MTEKRGLSGLRKVGVGAPGSLRSRVQLEPSRWCQQPQHPPRPTFGVIPHNPAFIRRTRIPKPSPSGPSRPPPGVEEHPHRKDPRCLRSPPTKGPQPFLHRRDPPPLENTPISDPFHLRGTPVSPPAEEPHPSPSPIGEMWVLARVSPALHLRGLRARVAVAAAQLAVLRVPELRGEGVSRGRGNGGRRPQQQQQQQREQRHGSHGRAGASGAGRRSARGGCGGGDRVADVTRARQLGKGEREMRRTRGAAACGAVGLGAAGQAGRDAVVSPWCPRGRRLQPALGVKRKQIGGWDGRLYLPGVSGRASSRRRRLSRPHREGPEAGRSLLEEEVGGRWSCSHNGDRGI